MLIPILDTLALVTAFAAAWFWLVASRGKLRRVSYAEELNAADLNRMIVAINRSQILNSRAALATAVSAFVVAIRFAVTLLTEA
jgi:hypothetical protein